MKIKHSKAVALVCLLLVSALLLVGCVSGNGGNGNSDANNNQSADGAGDKNNSNKTEIDAFTGLKVTFNGTSPRCTVLIDNTGCEANARSSVEYTTDKKLYEDKETVTVTATLTEKAKDSFILKSETNTYTVSSVPCYYTADMVVDTSLIKSEIKDIITAEVAQMGKTNVLFGIGGKSSTWHYSKVDSVISIESYLLTLKGTKMDEYGSDNAPFYNSLRIVADASVHTGGSDGNRSGHFYICFILNDVVVNTDGTIKWKNKKEYEITYVAKANDNTVADENVFTKSVYYNVQKLEKNDWIAVTYD